MVNVVVIVVAGLVVWGVISTVQRRRRGIVAERGTSIGADLGTLSDQPRVRVRTVASAGADRVRLILAPETDRAEGIGPPGPSDLDLVVFLREDEFGFEQLQDWQRTGSLLAMVVPPQSHLVRLRSIEELQPLTLRRVDEA